MNEPVWFRQNRDASDRFAAVLEHSGDGPAGAADDAEFADELAIVGMLQTVGAEPALGKADRARMRAALMAEAEAEPLAVVGGGKHAHVPAQRVTAVSRKTRRRASLAAAATAAGVVALGALGIELAQSALPGDLLYDVKRTTESISLDLTFSEGGKALKQLEMAATRIEELRALTERDAADGGATVEDVASYRAVIADLNSTVAAASRSVTSYGPQTDGADLRTLRDWTGEHGAQLAALQPAVPEAVVHQFTGSVELLAGVHQRALDLLARWECEQITAGQADQLGALPAVSECLAWNPGQHQPVQPRVSSQPQADENDSTGEQRSAPATDQPGAGTGDGSGGQPTGGPGVSLPTDAPTLVPQLPGAPEDDDPDGGLPDTDQGSNLPLLPLLTELPKIDLGIG